MQEAGLGSGQGDTLGTTNNSKFYKMSTTEFATKEDATRLAASKEKLAANYLDFEGFKAAIVRLTIISGDILGG